jgi:hypothetical protein
MGRYVRSPCPSPFPWLISCFRLSAQLTRVPRISIDLEPKGPSNASRCAYIINVPPFPRLEGNYAWATFSALAVTLDSRSVETGRSPYFLSIMLHIHCSYSLHSNFRLILGLRILYITLHGLRRKTSLTGLTRRRCDGLRFLSFTNQLLGILSRSSTVADCPLFI